MKRLFLTVVMLLMGMALVGGAAASLVGTALIPLDQQVGTHTSAAGAVLGIGLMAAAINPAANIGWVRAGILYGIVVFGFEVGSHFLLGAPFNIGPVVFGLACALLLVALYPERRALMPPTTSLPARVTPKAADTPPSPKPPETPEPSTPEPSTTSPGA
ncbi:MAG TPA: hypothetical protein VEL12_17645 [Candidatus Nitrosopolaris sp.]|nr:hypothetical protein [Candidatus Nitrosopolaris sp.]